MIRCPECGARFGGDFGFRRHRPGTWDRCRTQQEMMAIGLRRRRGGVWVRSWSHFQTQLPLRSGGGRARAWFGKSYRALDEAERREYRRRLIEGQELAGVLGKGDGPGTVPTAGSVGPRNAQRASPHDARRSA